MKQIKVDPKRTEEIVKNAFYLAWLACGGPSGMGFLQNKPDGNKEEVWGNVQTSGDYAMSHNKPNEPYGDYVFGRMMKLGIKYDPKKGIIEVRDDAPRWDYQSWCSKYKTYEDLINAAIECEEE